MYIMGYEVEKKTRTELSPGHKVFAHRWLTGSTSTLYSIPFHTCSQCLYVNDVSKGGGEATHGQNGLTPFGEKMCQSNINFGEDEDEDKIHYGACETGNTRSLREAKKNTMKSKCNNKIE